ncbi:MAG: hypothetical protein NT046_00745 [Arenimonas sp.]|nr:hypothetical protein [Arenimonas sp.]
MFKTFVFVLTLAAAPMVFADAPVAVDADDFSGQRTQIEKDLADGDTYVEISSADRGRVKASLERISALLEGGKTPEALSADQKVDLYNNQEIINTILTQAAADSRKVCTREAATGSNRRVTTCTTVAERTRRREKDQEALAQSRRGLVPLRD